MFHTLLHQIRTGSPEWLIKHTDEAQSESDEATSKTLSSLFFFFSCNCIKSSLNHILVCT